MDGVIWAIIGVVFGVPLIMFYYVMCKAAKIGDEMLKEARQREAEENAKHK